MGYELSALEYFGYALRSTVLAAIAAWGIESQEPIGVEIDGDGVVPAVWLLWCDADTAAVFHEVLPSLGLKVDNATSTDGDPALLVSYGRNIGCMNVGGLK